MRGELGQTGAFGTLRSITIAESDSQGRTRSVRYFGAGPLDELRLTEPTPAQLGEARTITGDRFDTRAYPLDADGCATALAFAESALTTLVGRLGERYRPADRISLVCEPTIQPELPPLASAFTNGTTVTFLTSQSMIVATGPGADWSRTVVTHELSHVLLFQRGNGPFLLVEGLPLWLTDDRRQPELDRVVRANAVWTLDHLVEGPRDATEFFAGYAQASSFVRFLADTFGSDKVIAAWENGRALRFPISFESAFGVAPETAYAAWRASLTR